MSLDETLAAGQTGHLADHAALKTEYDGRGASQGAVPTLAASSTQSEHATVHGVLHADHNALGNTPTLPTSGLSLGHLSHHQSLHIAYNLRIGESTWLPFNLPSRATLAATTKKVFAHYFVPFPISIDDVPVGPTEYIQQYWMPPGGIEGLGQEWETNHNTWGGFIRDRKIPRPPRGAGFEVLDRATDISQAAAAGLDGFIVDILQLSPLQRWTQLIETIDAADVVNDPYFKLVLMPDEGAGGTSTAMADNLATVANEASVYWHNDGGTNKLMIAPYNPEAVGTAFWSAVVSRLSSTYGIPSLLWPCYVANWTAAAQAPAFNSISYGHARWGDRDPVASGGSDTGNRGAPAHCHTTYSKPWMHFAAPQDERPRGGAYWEAGGSDNLRESWDAAIDGDADWVQIPTWDDFSENSQICPTEDSGYSWLDLNSYYLTWFKMGAAPTIVRDCVYLIHRPQPVTGVTYTGGQTQFMTLNGGTTARNEIEALAFLTAPADIEIRANGTLIGSAQSCSAGVTPVKRTLTNGTISARIVRNSVEVDSVTSPIPISTTQLVQDFTYRCFSSLRS